MKTSKEMIHNIALYAASLPEERAKEFGESAIALSDSMKDAADADDTNAYHAARALLIMLESQAKRASDKALTDFFTL